MSICLSLCLSICLSFCLSVPLSIPLSISLSISISLCLLFLNAVYTTNLFLSVCLSICLSLNVYLSILLSVPFSILSKSCLSLSFIFICLSVYLFVPKCRSVYPSLILSKSCLSFSFYVSLQCFLEVQRLKFKILTVCLSVCPSVFVYFESSKTQIQNSNCLSVCLRFCLSVCLSVRPSLSILEVQRLKFKIPTMPQIFCLRSQKV
jgi:hypothetical protein